jgi:hypothetical protein
VLKDAQRGTVGYYGIRLKDLDKRSQAGHIQGLNLPADEDLILIFSTSGDATVGATATEGVDIILFNHHITSETVRGAGTDPIDVPENKFRITVPAGQTGWALHCEFPEHLGLKRGAKRFGFQLIRVVGKDSGAEYPVGWNGNGEFLIVDTPAPAGRR